MTDTISVLVTLLVLVATLSTVVLAHEKTSPLVEESAEWCDNRDGDLRIEHSVAHGGLHCELPNGTVVHTADVVDVNESGPS